MKVFLTLCAVVCFMIFALTYKDEVISRETLLTLHRDKFHVEPRTSIDNEFTLTPCSDVQLPLANKWISNHNRTMRMFPTKTDNTHETVIVIQQAYKHQCFMLHAVNALEKATQLHWSAPTVISFESSAVLSYPIGYELDLRTLLYQNSTISHANVLSAKSLPEGDSD